MVMTTATLISDKKSQIMNEKYEQWKLVDKIKNQNKRRSANHENNSHQQKTSKCVNGFYDDLPEIFQIKMSPVQLKDNDIATSESPSI